MGSHAESRPSREQVCIDRVDQVHTWWRLEHARVRSSLFARIVAEIVMFALVLMQVERLHRIWTALARHYNVIILADFIRSGLCVVFFAVPLVAFETTRGVVDR